MHGQLQHRGKGNLLTTGVNTQHTVAANAVHGASIHTGTYIKHGELVGVILALLIIGLNNHATPECRAGVLPRFGAEILTLKHASIQIKVSRLGGNTYSRNEVRYGTVTLGAISSPHGIVAILITNNGLVLPHNSGIIPAHQESLGAMPSFTDGGIHAAILITPGKTVHH